MQLVRCESFFLVDGVVAVEADDGFSTRIRRTVTREQRAPVVKIAPQAAWNETRGSIRSGQAESKIIKRGEAGRARLVIENPLFGAEASGFPGSRAANGRFWPHPRNFAILERCWRRLSVS